MQKLVMSEDHGLADDVELSLLAFSISRIRTYGTHKNTQPHRVSNLSSIWNPPELIQSRHLSMCLIHAGRALKVDGQRRLLGPQLTHQLLEIGVRNAFVIIVLHVLHAAELGVRHERVALVSRVLWVGQTGAEVGNVWLAALCVW